MVNEVVQLDPTDLPALNAATASWAADGELVNTIDIAQVVIQESALDALAETVRSLGAGRPTLLVSDQTPKFRRGEDIRAIARDALARLGRVDAVALPEGKEGPFEATIGAAGDLAKRVSNYGAIVVIGSGSITDVAKYARHLAAEERGKVVPCISFPTAASVTAYTSTLAVLKVDGVKRTLAARAPDAIVCDLATLADAPRAMTLAGFGDVLARSVSYGDWYLAWQLGMDDAFSEIPGKLLEGAERAMIDRAEQIAAQETAGIRAVTEALLLAGMAMSVVNQTAPLSGWEHVISHFLDMTAAHDRRYPALHGAQVGVGTLVSAYAYERAWSDLDLARLEAERLPADLHGERLHIVELFSEFDPSGRMGQEVWRDYERKASRWTQSHKKRRLFVKRKRDGELDAYVRANVRPAEEVRRALMRATAPRQFDRLDPPISRERAWSAIRQGHLVRSRFTLGDFLDRSAWLTAENVHALLDATAK